MKIAKASCPTWDMETDGENDERRADSARGTASVPSRRSSEPTDVTDGFNKLPPTTVSPYRSAPHSLHSGSPPGHIKQLGAGGDYGRFGNDKIILSPPSSSGADCPMSEVNLNADLIDRHIANSHRGNLIGPRAIVHKPDLRHREGERHYKDDNIGPENDQISSTTAPSAAATAEGMEEEVFPKKCLNYIGNINGLKCSSSGFYLTYLWLQDTHGKYNRVPEYGPHNEITTNVHVTAQEEIQSLVDDLNSVLEEDDQSPNFSNGQLVGLIDKLKNKISEGVSLARKTKREAFTEALDEEKSGTTLFRILRSGGKVHTNLVWDGQNNVPTTNIKRIREIVHDMASEIYNKHLHVKPEYAKYHEVCGNQYCYARSA